MDNIQLVKSSIGISASSKEEDHKDVIVGDRSKLGFLISNIKRNNRGITNDDDDDRRLCKSHGSVSLCGRRRVMEDAVTIELGFLSNQILNYDFFGVYGGHGGSKVAQACRNQLHRVLAKEIEVELMVSASESIEKEDYDDEEEEDENLNWEKVMNSCFSKMDKEVIEEGNGSGLVKIIGSTAVVAIIGKGEIVVANCGDSRAVLSRGGIEIPLSRDHKPDRPDEMKRVEDAGGRVIDWNGYRVLGVLGTSRSIGDQYLKPYIISDPEVKVIKRTINDEFLVLASDGLWDVLANETVCQVVRECLEGRPWKRSSSSSSSRNHAYEAAAILAELAMARGSKDNISVVVVELTKPKG